MMKTIVKMNVPLSPDMLQVMTGLIDLTSRAVGLDNDGRTNAVLACEELFVYLVSHTGDSRDLLLRVMDGGYYVKITFIFNPVSLPVHVLNITAVSDPHEEASLEELELFIAARVVDRFIFDQSSPVKTKIHLIIEKQYPELVEDLPPPGSLPGDITLSSGRSEEIKQAAIRVTSCYGTNAPAFFRYPGKLVDMIACGEYQIILATDGKGTVYGCMVWKQNGRHIEGFGPFLFVPDPSLAEDLVQNVLETIGRSGATSLVIRSPLPDVPLAWFEEFPPLCIDETGSDPSASCRDLPLYRQLDEDRGGVVVVHADLVSQVADWYRQMYLPRQVTAARPAGEHIGSKTSFYVDIDKNQNLAVLTSCVPGTDAASVLAAHLTLLAQQGLTDIRFELDISNDTEAFLSPILIKAGFYPEYILPWGGQGDILVFRYRKGDE